jgi:predicted CoA-substrate-specific enzyme activase
VLINVDKQVLGHFVRRSGTDLAAAARDAFERAIQAASCTADDVQYIVATGYGRKNVDFAHDTKTEISCHGRGCHFYFPEAITVVDIGGQDSKIIKLNAQGRRTAFKMNRMCAAGTGAFLEEIAHRLGIPLSDLNRLAQTTTKTARIGSYCTVFTATEVLDRIRAGEKTEEIIRGLYDSIAKRIIEMETLTDRVMMTGGVAAHNHVVAEFLCAHAGIDVEIAPHAQEMGAFGAALFALQAA